MLFSIYSVLTLYLYVIRLIGVGPLTLSKLSHYPLIRHNRLAIILSLSLSLSVYIYRFARIYQTRRPRGAGGPIRRHLGGHSASAAYSRRHRRHRRIRRSFNPRRERLHIGKETKKKKRSNYRYLLRATTVRRSRSKRSVLRHHHRHHDDEEDDDDDDDQQSPRQEANRGRPGTSLVREAPRIVGPVERSDQLRNY